VYFKVLCTVKNHGHSPALAVSVRVETCLLGDGRRPEFILRNFCETLRIKPDHDGDAVFPSAEIQTIFMTFLPFGDIDRSLSGREFPAIFSLIYGCINYSVHGIKGVRQTGFASHLAIEGNGELLVIRGNDREWLNEKFVLTSPIIATAN